MRQLELSNVKINTFLKFSREKMHIDLADRSNGANLYLVRADVISFVTINKQYINKII